MTKRPDKETFLSEFNRFDDRVVAITNIADKYGVTERTVRNWLETYSSNITSSKTKSMDKNQHVFEFFKTIDEKYAEVDPRQDIEYRHVNIGIDPPNGKGILVVCMSDTHIGSAYTDMKRLAEDANIIKDTDGVYVVYPGDIIDFGPISASPRSLMHDQIMTFGEQKRIAHLLFNAIGHKILAVTSGCHGAWLYNETGEFFEEDLAELTITNAFLLHGGIVDLKLGDMTYKIFMSHKLGGNSKLNPTRGVFALHEQGLDFDIGIGAHNHTPCVHVMMRRGKEIVGIKCGTYKMLDTFANKLGFVQSPLTIPGFYISSKKRSIIPFIDWRQGLDML